MVCRLVISAATPSIVFHAANAPTTVSIIPGYLPSQPPIVIKPSMNSCATFRPVSKKFRRSSRCPSIQSVNSLALSLM
ncbi:Uncharacterised protein [Mycobacterium tuberculosis]|nr:Uncharacterised protein [Mycobacterium tuberculosis]